MQEEPENMGAWPFVKEHLRQLLGDAPVRAGTERRPYRKVAATLGVG